MVHERAALKVASEEWTMKNRPKRTYFSGKKTGGDYGMMLPRVTLENGKTYWIDERLKQLRNVTDPHDYIDF